MKMYKRMNIRIVKISCGICLFLSSIQWGHSQIGINTESPSSLFHIDAKQNTTSATGNVADDIVVTADGKMGIGTASPSNKLTIETIGTGAGLFLPNGAGAGSILTSDVNGQTVWKPGAIQFQTEVYGDDNTNVDFSGAVVNITQGDKAKKLFMTRVVFDKAKEIYGAGYGWDATNSQYKVPIDGIYRIAFSVYFYPILGQTGQNMRAYLYKTQAGVTSAEITSGIVSLTDLGNHIIGYVMGASQLKKDDILDLRVFSSSGEVSVYLGQGHTFLLIELLSQE